MRVFLAVNEYFDPAEWFHIVWKFSEVCRQKKVVGEGEKREAINV